MKRIMLVLCFLGVVAPMCFIGCGGGGGGSTAPAPVAPVTQTRFPMTGSLKAIPDAGGYVISGAPVVLTDASSGATYNDTTDSSGAFSFSGLPTGNFTLSISSTGASQDFTGISQAVTMTATATLEILATPEYALSVDVVNINDSNEEFATTTVAVNCTSGYSQSAGTVLVQANPKIVSPATFANVPHSSTCTAQVTNPSSANGVGTDTATVQFAADADKTVQVLGTKPLCWTDTVATLFCTDPDLGNVTAVCDNSGTAESAFRCVEN